MKQIFILLFSFLAIAANAQVAISNPASNPDPSAMLDVKSTNKGFLMPRVTNRTNVTTPATGLLVYETTTNAVWVYNGTAWVQLGSGGGTNWLVNGTHIYNGNTGNVGIGTSAPEEKLQILGSMKLEGSARLIKFETAVGGTGSPFTSPKYAPGLQFLREGTTTQLAKVEYVDTVNATNFLRFYTGTTASNDLTVTTDHNVGIGTQTPLLF